MNIYRWDDFKVLDTIEWNYNMPANDVQLLNDFDLHAYLEEKSFNINEIIAEFHLIDNTGVHLSKNFAIPGDYDKLGPVYAPKSELQIIANKCDQGTQTISLEVRAQKPALFISIVFTHGEIKKYRLSRNGFMQLNPIEAVELTFENPSCLQTVDASNFEIHSLNQFLPGFKSSSANAFRFLNPFFLPLIAIFALLNLKKISPK